MEAKTALLEKLKNRQVLGLTMFAPEDTKEKHPLTAAVEPEREYCRFDTKEEPVEKAWQKLLPTLYKWLSRFSKEKRELVDKLERNKVLYKA